MRKTKTLILVAVLCAGLSVPSICSGYSFNLWGSMTGAKTLALNPFLYGAIGPFDATLDLVAGYGVSDRLDVYADLAGLYYDGFGALSYSGSWVMPRFDLGANNILALSVGESFDSSTGAASFYLWPQYHFFWENDKFALEFNGGVNIPLDAPETSSALLFFAPVYKILDGTFHVFCEIDPSYIASGVDKGFDLTLLPGFWFGFGEEALHQFSIGVSVGGWWNDGKLNGRPSYTWNIWYWTTFSLGGE